MRPPQVNSPRSDLVRQLGRTSSPPSQPSTGHERAPSSPPQRSYNPDSTGTHHTASGQWNSAPSRGILVADLLLEFLRDRPCARASMRRISALSPSNCSPIHRKVLSMCCRDSCGAGPRRCSTAEASLLTATGVRVLRFGFLTDIHSSCVV